MLGMGQNEFMFSIDDFLGKEGGLCREERQYALFLYNSLCVGDEGIDKEIIEKIFKNQDIEIKKVFYEATFMRDYFCADRKRRLLGWDKEKCCHNLEQSDQLIKNKLNNKVKKQEGHKTVYEKIEYKDVTADLENRGDSFNEKLVRFLAEKYNVKNPDRPITQCSFYINRNFGTNNFSKQLNGGGIRVIASVAKAMMNAKPDIAVYYEDKEDKKEKLLFLECKYCSDESTYEDIMECLGKLGITDITSKGQVAIQDLICEFLCESLFAGEVKKCSTKIIRFGEMENLKTENIEDNIIEENTKEILIDIGILLKN